jgi:deazaflavin-dependent oxidoreductase (nitroreductase family)
MTTAVSRSTPPQRLINAMNPVVRALLRSPLHAAVDGALLMLHVTGRKTGRPYDIPVGYLDLDGRFVVVTQHTWRANLRGVADVEVTYAGHRRTMHADLDEEPGSVAATLYRMIDRIGWQAARRQLGLTITVRRTPSLAELEEAVREYDLATVTLTAK